jgi:hypothetical protein
VEEQRGSLGRFWLDRPQAARQAGGQAEQPTHAGMQQCGGSTAAAHTPAGRCTPASSCRNQPDSSGSSSTPALTAVQQRCTHLQEGALPRVVKVDVQIAVALQRGPHARHVSAAQLADARAQQVALGAAGGRRGWRQKRGGGG